MATDTFKVLAQSKPGAASLTAAYTVPGATQAVVATVVVCNQSATATSFRISVAIAGAADTAAQYLYYDVPINGNDTFVATIGVTLGAADVVRVYNTLATLSFNVFGVEVA
jgi:hypothetical protein